SWSDKLGWGIFAMSEVGVQRGAVESTAPIDRPSGRRRGDRIVGAGRATQELVEIALVAARSDRPVVITGPHGSGNDHLARGTHAWGARVSAPFAVVSVASLPDGQLARELFGSDGEPGAVSRAAGGTLVIDGADRLPEAVQGQPPPLPAQGPGPGA